MARGHLANEGRDGKRQAEEGGFAPWTANRTTLHLLASKSSESRSKEDQVVTGRGADEQAQKDAWGPRGWEPALQSASSPLLLCWAQAPSKPRAGIRQARLLWETGVCSAARTEVNRILCKKRGKEEGGDREREEREREREKERRREGETEKERERETKKERKEGGTVQWLRLCLPTQGV